MIFLLRDPRLRISRARSNPRYKWRKMSTCRRRLLRNYMIPVMSPQDRILVIGSRQMRMVIRNLLRRTLNTTYGCGGRHAFGNQSRDTAQFRICRCVLLGFGTLNRGLFFLGGENMMKSLAFNWFLAPALYWLIT